MIAKMNKMFSISFFNRRRAIERARLNPLDCRDSFPQYLLELDQITYKSCDFTSIFGGTFHKNLGQHVLSRKENRVSKWIVNGLDTYADHIHFS